MMKISKLFGKIGLVIGYSFLSLQTAYAEDTEVFFAPANSTATIKPNVMFIIDTSGSMRWGVDGTYNVPYEERRLTIVKNVMDDLLTDLQNVNAGLMRFTRGNSSDSSAKGGPVLFPVLDIDLPATPIVEQEVSNGANDGYEDGGTVVWLNTQQLNIDGAAAAYTGLRFEGLNIPQGATIKRATVSFTANGDSTGAAKFNIYGQLVPSAPAFTTAITNISARLATPTTNVVTWEPVEWSDRQSYTTPDIKDVVQEMVDQADWCGGNDLALLIEGTGNEARVAYSAEGDAAFGGADEESDNVTAARIRVEYESILPPGANGCITGNEQTFPVVDGAHDTEQNLGVGGLQLDFESNNLIGVGFANVDIRQGTTIEDAYIEFTARADDGGSATADIWAVNSNNPPMDDTMIWEPSRTASVNWSGIEDWDTNEVYRTVSVTSIVQALVNRSDWDAGTKDMAFVVDFLSGANNRRARSYNDDPARAPRLVVSLSESVYTPGAITLREDLRTAVQGLPHTGNTPISDTIAEAGLYFTGGNMLWGQTRNNHQNNRVSHPLSYINGTQITPAGCSPDNPDDTDCRGEVIIGNPQYISPIVEQCQTNHIVYLTDGAPTSHHIETEQVYSAWTGGSSCNRGNARADCAIDIAGYLHNNDLSPLPGKQTINTHMIGFGSGADPVLMKQMADAGGGGHYSAQSKDELVAVLKTIVDSIASVSTTFVTTGVTVNQYNRLTNSEQLYFSLFTPSSQNVWPGNVKRYRLANGEIVDFKGNNAIDKLSGEFSKDSQSYWSDGIDGNRVDEGGVAEQLTNNRKIFTNIVSTDISSSANRFNETNITSAMLNTIDEQDRLRVIHWTMGVDVDDPSYSFSDPFAAPAHKQIADPLHSQPSIVSYATGGSSLDVVFVGTNDGFLRAFDTDENSGEELWSFIPKELLDRLSSIQKGVVSSHNYGIDGSISIYIDDANNNGQVDVGSEKAYLYVGMRRGGRSYYAIDISNPSAPSLKFIISGASGVGPGQVGSAYAKLGQTWSRPIIGKLKLPGGNSDDLVMVFGGGYDTGQDLAGTPARTDAVGNVVYIANALTGDMLWSSDSAIDPGESEGPLNMNSVPADITAFDLDGDDYIDHMYASDTKAQIFRFDVDKDTQTIKGGRIASLQTAADVANNRRFYYPVDAALIKLIDDSFVSVSIGSGYRAHPLDENITDHFYMIRDEGVLKGQFDMDVTMGDLTDVSSLIGDSDGDGTSDAAAQIEADGNNGWYVSFSNSGEKVIERSITFNNAVIFTTYLPPSNSGNSCEAAAGGSRIYGLRIVDGNPYLDTNFDGQINESDRYAELVGAGIAPPPQVLLEGTDEGVKPRLCVGTQCNLEDFLPDTTQGIVGYRWSN
ncbi:hypothetical protein FLL45_02425 [Aliikangiella marina]|uniref:Uncharacterized protein n=1 Tax=Aliikangiella marina TaxID=1712262 RepID=A0A545TI37_9GAMM|nr:PilC/PilY family type IV pilus protein [Aliikangiella marina]TQV76831.1 hypothetical protein FLL45_02425 [Aliikangiella marina]